LRTLPNPQSAICNPQSTAPFFDHRARFAVGLALALSLAFVVELLALCNSYLQFYASILQVHLCGNESEALLLDLTGELVYFGPVQQQLPRARRFVIVAIAMAVGTDVNVYEPRFRASYLRVAVFQIASPFSNRFHLRARQRDTAFVSLEDVEVVVGLSIGRHHFIVSHNNENVSSGQRGKLPLQTQETIARAPGDAQ